MDLIQIFNSIRDIPFRIPLSPNDTSIDCDGRHKKLFEALSRKGLEVRFRVCSFLWSELAIPDQILSIKHKDECEHLFLEVFLNNEWLILDATWDKGLKNIFHINEWDGISGTEIAVKPIKIYDPKKTILTHGENEEAMQKDISESGDFYLALNKWIEENRI